MVNKKIIVDTRYPPTWPIGQTKKDAREAQEAAKKIGDFVKEKLK